MYEPTLSRRITGVPVLTNWQIDQIAEDLLHDYKPALPKKPVMIDLLDVLKNYLHARFDDTRYLSNDGRFLGVTVFNSGNLVFYNRMKREAELTEVYPLTVYVDSTLTERGKMQRYRYTIGHEIGHIVLHESYFTVGEDGLNEFDTDPVQPDMYGRKHITAASEPLDEWSDTEWLEWQADTFSSALLMPGTMVMMLSREIDSKKHVNSMDHDIDMVKATMYSFCVSKEAAVYRLQHFGLIEQNNVNDIMEMPRNFKQYWY
jgi:Zn-dependent peptidase ImmA (M78 family)